ncbi:hypothetical protein, partial [Pantoea sp.]|uniref:hypothetical protein n=1 Tax=Pantoea sp. TaxID=69393 RepID=UPI0028A88897
VWVFGCLGVWVFGCLGVWVFASGYSDHPTTRYKSQLVIFFDHIADCSLLANNRKNKRYFLKEQFW